MKLSNYNKVSALRMEAWSINYILRQRVISALNRNLLTGADSLTAEQYYVLLYYRIIFLILCACRNAQTITMITNAQGTIVSGDVDNTGAATIRYKPYGEVNRTNSAGADIFRYKYTAQEDDQETGLYFYKARYYDPYIGRFMQSDSVTNAVSLTGQDLYQYVDGNPVMYRDPSGNNAHVHMFNQMAGHALGGLRWASKAPQEAVRSYNQFVYGKHHGKNGLADKYARSDSGRFHNKLGAEAREGLIQWKKSDLVQLWKKNVLPYYVKLADNIKLFLKDPVECYGRYLTDMRGVFYAIAAVGAIVAVILTIPLWAPLLITPIAPIVGAVIGSVLGASVGYLSGFISGGAGGFFSKEGKWDKKESESRGAEYASIGARTGAVVGGLIGAVSWNMYVYDYPLAGQSGVQTFLLEATGNPFLASLGNLGFNAGLQIVQTFVIERITGNLIQDWQNGPIKDSGLDRLNDHWKPMGNPIGLGY